MFDNMGELEKRFNEAGELLRRVKPSEFLETILTESQITKTSMMEFRALADFSLPRKKRGDDIPDPATECSYVYAQFANYLTATDAKNVLIVNPSIPFIRKWCKDKMLTEVETHFLTEWESSAAILESEFSGIHPRCHFLAITQSHMMQDNFDACLFFYRDYVDELRYREYGERMIWTSYIKAVFWLLPDEKAKEVIKARPIYSDYEIGETLDAMDILPTDCLHRSPKKGLSAVCKE